MKKLLMILLFLFIWIGCDTNYKPNYQINHRPEPIIIVAIDTTLNSVVMIDGNNKVFTIYDNPTTKAITSTLSVRDTLRPKQLKVLGKNF